MRKIIVLAASLFFLSCASHDKTEDLRKQLSDHEARTFAIWADWQKKDIREKVFPAPDVLIDYLRIDNKLNGYNMVPKPAKDWKEFAAEVAQAIDEFPPEVRRHLNEHVTGIFLVTDLGSSAFTDVLRDFANHPLGFIVLDTQALNRKANDWATWRENTPFGTSAGPEVRVIIEPEARDLRKNTIAYIILHELGHLIGVAKGCHANWWVDDDPANYGFSAMSWILRNGIVSSKWDAMFHDRNKVRFYADEKSRLSADRIMSIYNDLEKTDYVSLYGATGIYDDFAETYAMYVHVVLQGRPWNLSVFRDGASMLTIDEPIQKGMCWNKRKYLSTLFKEKS